MKGRKFKRLTAAIVALSMVGTSFPADVGLTGLFDGFALTASAEDEFSYARELFGEPVEHEGYDVYYLNGALTITA